EEREVAAAPVQSRERVGDGNAREHDAERCENGVLERVERPAPKRRRREHVDEVVPRKRMRPEPGRERLVVRHQRGERDEEERQEECDRRRDQHAVVRDREQEAAASHRGGRPSADELRCRDCAHRAAALYTQRLELTMITSVTAKETTSSST